MSRISRPNIGRSLLVSLLLSGGILVRGVQVSAACSAPTTDYGTVTSSVSISTAGSYRVWSRMQIPNSTANSYMLEIDGGTCYVVGGNSSVTPNTWTWIDYQGGNTSSKINATLSAGTHTIKMIGTADSVLLDRLIFTQDTTAGSSCNPPIGLGDSCVAVTSVNIPPTVTMSTSLNSGTAPLNVTLTATATDLDGTISKVEFFNGSTSVGLGTKSGNTFTKTLTGLTAGTYNYTAKATDNDGASTSSTPAKTVTVNPTSTCTASTGPFTYTDLLNVLNNWGTTQTNRTGGELNCIGTVNYQDLLLVLNNWG